MSAALFILRFVLCLAPAVLVAIVGGIAGVVYRASERVLEFFDRFLDWSTDE